MGGFFFLQDPLRKIPGPTAWPLVGNALMLNPKRLHVQLCEMAKEYGPMMKIYMFNSPIVVVNSTDLCYDALNRNGKKDSVFMRLFLNDRVKLT